MMYTQKAELNIVMEYLEKTNGCSRKNPTFKLPTHATKTKQLIENQHCSFKESHNIVRQPKLPIL